MGGEAIDWAILKKQLVGDKFGDGEWEKP